MATHSHTNYLTIYAQKCILHIWYSSNIPKSLGTGFPARRILFIFDVNRNCRLLIGGSKKGKNEEDFYGKLIKRAEDLIEKYPEIQEGKDG